jgi:hypothetical protein
MVSAIARCVSIRKDVCGLRMMCLGGSAGLREDKGVVVPGRLWQVVVTLGLIPREWMP